MTPLETTQAALLKAEAHARDLRAGLVNVPGSFGIKVALANVERQIELLRVEFAEAVEAAGASAVDYRIQSEPQNLSILDLSRILAGFQRAFTLAIDWANDNVLSSGPSRSAQRVSELRLSYTYQGSVGVVLTSPEPEKFFVSGECEKALEMLSRFATSGPDGMEELARKAGLGLSRAVHGWLKAHEDIPADIATVGPNGRRFHIDPERARQSALALELMEQTEDLDETVVGRLVGIDWEFRTFTLRTPSRTIHGKLGEGFEPSKVEVPSDVTAHLSTVQRTRYSDENVTTTYTLSSMSLYYEGQKNLNV